MRRADLSGAARAGVMAAVWVLTAAAGAWGQQSRTVAAEAPPGWLGIQTANVRIADVNGDRGASSEITITRVLENEAAWSAGIRSGDVIETIYGEPVNDSVLRLLTETLRAGDEVPLVVRRGGRSFVRRVRATPRPAARIDTRLAWGLDSAASAVFRALDSLRIPTWVDTGATMRWRFGENEGGEPGPPMRPASAEFTVVIGNQNGEQSTWSYSLDAGTGERSFEAYVLHSPDLERLASGLDAIRGELADLETRQNQRLIELGPDRTGDRAARDEALRAIRTSVERLEGRSRLLEQQMARQSVRRVGPLRDSLVRVRIGTSRPITPYAFMGRDFFAGALVAPVRGGLGRYFGVETGVLVVDVAAGSPADEAGIQAGDVIVGVGDDEPTDPAALRRALAAALPPVDVAIVRDRARIRLRIR